MDQIICPNCSTANPRGPAECSVCGAALKGAPRVKVAEVGVSAVRITDIKIPLDSMIALVFKFSVACIPVVFLFAFLWAALAGVFGVFSTPR